MCLTCVCSVVFDPSSPPHGRQARRCRRPLGLILAKGVEVVTDHLSLEQARSITIFVVYYNRLQRKRVPPPGVFCTRAYMAKGLGGGMRGDFAFNRWVEIFVPRNFPLPYLKNLI